MMQHFNRYWKILDKSDRDLTDPEIGKAHRFGNLFFGHYVDMFPEGVTNYLHLIGAGHITYYLRKYRSLYRFSQQGWEALNKLIKNYYHHKTNHGGCQGTKNGPMVRGLHMEPVANLISRRHCWLLRHGQDFFYNVEYCQAVSGAEEEPDSESENEEEGIPQDVLDNPFAF